GRTTTRQARPVPIRDTSPVMRPAPSSSARACRTTARFMPGLTSRKKNDRKNDPVIDRVTVALPAELSREQNLELLQAFGERITWDTRSGQQIERDEGIIAEKRTIEQITEEQQRKQQADEEKWRKIELELYLAQRDRERHFDLGRYARPRQSN